MEKREEEGDVVIGEANNIRVKSQEEEGNYFHSMEAKPRARLVLLCYKLSYIAHVIVWLNNIADIQ